MVQGEVGGGSRTAHGARKITNHDSTHGYHRVISVLELRW